MYFTGSTKKIFYALSFTLSIGFVSCKKASWTAPVYAGAVALTFDDDTVDNWYAHLALLDSLNIKATFYISRYHGLTTLQRAKLKAIQQHGHEIGYHTTHHANLAKLLQQKGLGYVVSTEIEQDLNKMHADGFYPSSFAYPYGSHTEELDVAVSRYFTSLRAVSNKQNWEKSLVKESPDRLLYGAGIDEDAKISDGTIKDLLERARKNSDCIVLTAHKLLDGPQKRHISSERLHLLHAIARQNNLKFIRASDIFR